MPLANLNTARASSAANEVELKPKKAAAAKPTLRETLQDAVTGVVGDTLDFTSISFNNAEGTAITPSVLLHALNTQQHISYHLWVATRLAIEEFKLTGKFRAPSCAAAIFERLIVEIGKVLLYRSPDRPHFTLIDPRLHSNASGICASARRLISMFEDSGIHRRSVFVSIPATDAGLRAAHHLQTKYKIHTNLIYVSSLAHAAACAETNTRSVAMAVGPILDWYETKRKAKYTDIKTHPGVQVIQAAQVFFIRNNVKASLLGVDLRSASELAPLACLDGVFADAGLLDTLSGSHSSFILQSVVPETSPAYGRAKEFSLSLPEAYGNLKAHELSERLPCSSDKDALRDITYHTLGRMQETMGKIDGLIVEELTWTSSLLDETKQKQSASSDKVEKHVHESRPSSPSLAGTTRTDSLKRQERTSSIPRRTSPLSRSDSEATVEVESVDYF